ncbi:MAG: hypothetical protein A2X61_10550 [Ignavibacteria bacterium GWB2_35_12]|nr:MAG: hypothetical protein A2X63_03410 [Ignavibacteria bacterium GWA2_35_8]OGU42076.1 MAG: hypothetical protein A2X61_10550 [Ignavibacteria bacterium GWB2_35_12]OGU92628.1 MAG: hypothetical protein A2220_03740 [Ignavibacteria bacterium RIFOXYA2_FULL_35_10]OGV24854.1 MAG: hypothetical protein A2475_02890 [Ignavibacteria bacterium RIFOXYC2_FULL_35_21]
MDNDYKIIDTKILKGRIPDFHEKRKVRISEAILFKLGTKYKPKKTLITTLFNGKEVYFMKPGKEVFRENPNIHDMYPCIGKNGNNEVEGFAFDDIWEYLIKISIINQLTFKKVLTIIYRLCYFFDHTIIEQNKIRYNPNEKLTDYLFKLDFSLKDGFADKFKKEELGLFEFLHFIDLLGWNEDVKYNTIDSKPFIGKNKRTGRVNTILSIISVPLMVNDFLANIIENVNYIEKINVKLILSTMQKLSKSRGICVLTNRELVNYLKPFLIQ